ncbi:MAG: outer membrane lipoprotein chaperone LolA [Wenzhouxiangella sp.]|jgi:outer membrane lipoprotein carrier protein|nr:outer membrane lipoprotein chaperone LolA [Wenzhouxiangella sp.]
MKILLALSLLLAAGPLTAEANPRALLDDFARDLESLSGEFTQTTLAENGRVSESSQGRLFYQRPDRFRWSYDEPFPQEMVADGERLWHFDESLDQVTVREQPSAAESPLLVLTRPELLDRFYQVEPGDAPDQLGFRPLAEAAEFERATLFFRDGLPRALELLDSFGQLTRIELFDLERNPALDPALFEFEVPDGVDVLEGY